MWIRTVFDMHRHGPGTNVHRRYLLLIRYLLTVLVLAYDVEGDLRDTHQPTTSQANNQQTVHASVGEIRLHQYLVYEIHQQQYLVYGVPTHLIRTWWGQAIQEVNALFHRPSGYPTVQNSTFVELHADLFSRNASPLEVYVFVTDANRGEDIMSNEICRRFNRKQQYRRRRGRSVCSSQTGLWSGILIRDMYACIRTYYVRPNTSGENEKHPPEVRSRDGHTCRTCVQKLRSISYKTS